MNTLKNQIADLIKDAESSEYRKYESEWQRKAVDTLNEYYQEYGLDDHEIYDLSDDVWDEIVKYNLESRGWLGVKFLLQDISNTSEWGRLDAYGNGESVDYDLLDFLKEALDEIDD